MADEEHTLVLDEAQPLGTPITDPTEANLAQAEYQLLLNKLLVACNGTRADVGIACAMSAAFCMAVDSGADMESARDYLRRCYHDAEAQLEHAFSMKAQLIGAANGNDAGEQSESSH